uniref:D-ribitol-5-phosphate cytidylyltransferase isoform X4 n=1 Tax=Pristiophorus japonicus TaxID=55135 RepID=UPI00398EEA4B
MAEAPRDSQRHRPLVCNFSSQSEQAAGNRGLDFSVAAVLPAGGSGERMGMATPKQFCQLLQRPLISVTLETFERVHWIKEIVVVVSKQNFELMNSIIDCYGHSKTTVVEGARTRHQSIFNGLKAFVENRPGRAWLEKPEVVIIHDAVRPFVEEDILFSVATAAKEYGCTDYDFEYGTECLHLALQYCGTSAKLIDGPSDLWKVTYKRDLHAAEAIIKESLSKSVCIITGIQEEQIQLGFLLQEALQLVMKVDVLKWSLSKESHCLQAISSGLYYNFIYITVNNFDLPQEIVQLVESIGIVKLSALYPVVVTVVHLNNSETASSCIRMEDFTNSQQLAKEANRKNVLVYRLLINYTQDMDKVQESVKQGASIINLLINQRSPALIGQLLVV